ncbi:MAG TPA: hypothetical protein PLN38_03780 [Chitinophagales bacterium]|nr:hypothetical protein [Chitinophagales bacterium]
MSKTKLWGIIGGGALLVFFTVYMLFFNKRNETVLNAMPNDVLCFFDIKKANDFSIALNQNEIFGALRQTSMIGTLHSDFNLYAGVLSTNPELLSDLLNSRVVAGAFTTGNTKIDYLILLQLDEAAKLNLKNFKPVINQQNPDITTHTFERSLIYELSYKGTDTAFSFALENGIFIFSTTSVLVENAILQLKKGNPVTENEAFQDVFSNLNNASNNNYAFYINTAQMADYFSMFSTNEKYASIMQMKNYVSWIGLQPELKTNGIELNGYASAKGEQSTLSLGQYTGQLATDMHPAVPDNVAVLYRINSTQLSENFASKLKDESANREFFDYWSPWMAESLIVGLSETLDGNLGKRAFVIVPTLDMQLAKSKLKYALVSDTLSYKGIDISTFNCFEMAEKLSGIQLPEVCYGFWQNDALVIAFDYLQITNLIDAATGNRGLSKNAQYLDFKKEISASFNASVYLDLAKSEKLITGYIADKHLDSLSANLQLLKQFSQLELQFTQNKNVYLVNGFVHFETNPQKSSGSLWKIDLDAPVQSGPFCVYNDVSRQHCVLVQDTANQLIQISLNGDVQWKLSLDSKILSDIHEVDFYNNDKTQFVFNTQNAIYLVDAQGEAVEGFPITLTTRINNAIAVIDKDKENYKMFVACDNGNIYGYYKDGKPIAGWSPLKGAGIVNSSIFDFTSKGNQVFGFVNDKGIQLKKENGNSLQVIPLKSAFADMIQAGNQIGVIDQMGNIIVVDSLLQVQSIPGKTISGKQLILDVQHDDTLDVIYFDESYFKANTILGNNIFVTEAALAVDVPVKYTAGSNTYFGYNTLDNRLFLFDADGKVINGFPIEGSAKTTIKTISSNGDKMLITVIGNAVLAYRIL